MPPGPYRGRRLRRTPALRALVRETSVRPEQLVLPVFVTAERESAEIPSMPGVFRLTVDDCRRSVAAAASAGIGGVILFGIPAVKDDAGTSAWSEDGPVPIALRHLASDVGDALALIADVCLCEYTTHGHCGVVADGRVVNDRTLPLLGKTAACYAAAGAHVVAPSDMMDGRVASIRAALDTCGFDETAILSYSSKHASAFYGPFRDAAGSTPQFGDRKTYQMDPANRRESLREIAADISEGADMVLVKPALACLDLIREAVDAFSVPVGAYSVSGEYSMVRAAAEKGWLDEAAAVNEMLHAFRRAGAQFVITYHAAEAARRLNSLSD